MSRKEMAALVWVWIVMILAGLVPPCGTGRAAEVAQVKMLPSYQFGRDWFNGASNAASSFLNLGAPVNVKVVSAAAAADGVTDDTTLVSAAFSGLNTGDALYLQGKNYAVTSLSISKSGYWLQGPGTLTFLSTNANPLILTGNEWRWVNVTVAGAQKSACGIFVNNASKRWKLLDGVVKDIYGDANADPGASAVIAGISVRRGNQDFEISGYTITNVAHASAGTRVSGGIVLTDFGQAGTNDYVQGGRVLRNYIHTIAPGVAGGGIRVTTTTGGLYNSGTEIALNQIYNVGRYGIKVIGDGVMAPNNYVESFDTNLFAAFAGYGRRVVFPNCLAEIAAGRGVVHGTYGTVAEGGGANGTRIRYTPAQTSFSAFELLGDATGVSYSDVSATGARNLATLSGNVRHVKISGMATNISGDTIQLITDGTNAPYNNQVTSLLINGGGANGVNVAAGTNNDVGFVSGSVAALLVAYASGVTGSRVMTMTGDGQAFTAGGVTATNVTMPAAGKMTFISGTNQRAGDTTLVAGTKAVANTTVTANTRVFLTRKAAGGTIGDLSYTVSAGVGFTVNSANAGDTSTVSYWLLEVN